MISIYPNALYIVFCIHKLRLISHYVFTRNLLLSLLLLLAHSFPRASLLERTEQIMFTDKIISDNIIFLRQMETMVLIHQIQLDPANLIIIIIIFIYNLNSVISNFPIFRTQNHFPWICPSVIYYCYFELLLF